MQMDICESKIAMGKDRFYVKKDLPTSKLDLKLRKRIVKATSIALCGAETWTITQNHWKKFEAFEMRIWREILKISWT